MLGRIRYERVGGLIIALVLLVMLGWTVASRSGSASVRVQMLADGTVLHVEGVTFDKPGQKKRPLRLSEKAKIWLAGILPERFGNKIHPSRPPAAVFIWPNPPGLSTNAGTLHVWLRRDIDTNEPAALGNYPVWRGELVNQQGQIFRSVEAVATVSGSLWLETLTFEDFPRQQAKLGFRLFDRYNLHITDFTVDNPAFGSKAGD